ILKKSIFELVYPDSRSPVRTQPFKSSAEGVYYEAIAKRKDGTNFSAEVSLQSAEIGSDKALLSIQRDITERKRVQQELEKAREYAEAANFAKSEFLANMSHEIRTPLNGMLGMIDLTLLTDLTTEQRENLFIAKNCAANLLNLINDILDFSRIEAKKLNLENISFDFKKLIEQTTTLHQIKARQKGVKLSYGIDPQIPLYINGDPNRLEQIINNLLGNAVKFTETGEIKLLINLKVATAEYLELEFQVSDTGVGMDGEELKRIFSSFNQADSSITRKYGGTGLGLAISKQLVEMMGGSIWVNSEKGRGSDFYFTIRSGQKLLVPKSEQEELDTIPKVEQPLKILLAEDDKINQLVTGRILKEAGHQVETASNGADAFKIISEGRIDLALMDIQMPAMDGLEVVKRVRKMEQGSGKYTPIIALTAYALKGDREKYLAAGMDDYLAKPIQINDLLEVIDRNQQKIKTAGAVRSLTENEFYIEPEKLEQKDLLLAYRMNVDKAIEEIAVQLAALKAALEKEDFLLLEKAAHQIKKLSQAANISSIRTAIFKLELAARREDLAVVTKHYDYVSIEFDKIKSKLDANNF
ncbi:MAG: ATP-binding protein, partial [Bacillota bacterium]